MAGARTVKVLHHSGCNRAALLGRSDWSIDKFQNDFVLHDYFCFSLRLALSGTVRYSCHTHYILILVRRTVVLICIVPTSILKRSGCVQYEPVASFFLRRIRLWIELTVATVHILWQQKLLHIKMLIQIFQAMHITNFSGKVFDVR